MSSTHTHFKLAMVGIIVTFGFKTNSFHGFETKISTAIYCWKINELGKPKLTQMAQTRLFLTFLNSFKILSILRKYIITQAMKRIWYNIIRVSLPSEMRIVEGLIDFSFSYKLISY